MARNAGLLRRLLVLAGVVVAASALPQAAMSLRSADDDVVVTRQAIALPAGCTPRDVASRFMEFFAALEAAETSSLAAFFAKEDPPGKATEPAGRAFRWYSVTEGGGAGPETGGNREPLRHFVAYDVADLLPYLAERQQQHERMRLVAVEVGTSNTAGSAGGTSSYGATRTISYRAWEATSGSASASSSSIASSGGSSSGAWA